MEKEFDYAGAVKELEEIAVKVEDPSEIGRAHV